MTKSEPVRQIDGNTRVWLKIHNSRKPQLDGLSFDAAGVWIHLAIYCTAKGNGGSIPLSKIPVAIGRKISGKRLEAALAELAEEVPPMIVLTPTTLEMDDVFKVDNPSPEEFADPIRRWKRKRNRDFWHMDRLQEAVRKRDRELCRYCGVRVDWREGAKFRPHVAGTYDHVDPMGDNTFENIVVACHRCNIVLKKERTPEQAGMPLLRPGTTAADVARASASAASTAPSALPDTSHPPDDDGPVAGPVPDRAQTGVTHARARTRTDVRDSPRNGPEPDRSAAHRGAAVLTAPASEPDLPPPHNDDDWRP